jgi:AcrR family transcriptional regulator
MTAQPADGSAGPLGSAVAGTRERALVAALDLFSREGYDAVSMREIAEELGVSKAALYHHFTSKQEIARELIGGYLAAVDELVTWARATEPDLSDLLARWADLVRRQGLAVGRFIHANQRMVRELGLQGNETRRAVDRVADTVIGPDEPPELRMQVRIALICLHTAAIAGEGLGMSEDEVFAIARAVAASIVRNTAR